MSRSLKTTYGGGGFYLSIAVDYTVFAANGRVQAFNFTAASKKLILPDARTLQRGHMFYLIGVAGSQTFNIHDNALNNILGLLGNVCGILHLTDNSTQAGSWLTWTEQIWHIGRNN